ncbi:MAG: IS3 family transposase, partial [Actinomycetota bacterium]|nr:IS3 family transposase [Actinomycetota bacterium]
MTGTGTTGRAAAQLTGMSRATMARRAASGPPASAAATPHRVAERVEPVNKLDDAEREEVLAVLNSDRFVDAAPAQVYATLLAEDCYLCSISTMYRILGANQQVKERRRLA